jgi:hypothetical protein
VSEGGSYSETASDLLEKILSNPKICACEIPNLLKNSVNIHFDWNYQCKSFSRTTLMILINTRPQGYLDAIKILIEEKKVNLDLLDKNGCSAFVHAAYAMKDPAIVDLILMSDRFDLKKSIESIPEKFRQIVLNNLFKNVEIMKNSRVGIKKQIYGDEYLSAQLAHSAPDSYLLIRAGVVYDTYLMSQAGYKPNDTAIGSITINYEETGEDKILVWIRDPLKVTAVVGVNQLFESTLDSMSERGDIPSFLKLIDILAMSHERLYRKLTLKKLLHWCMKKYWPNEKSLWMIVEKMIGYLKGEINADHPKDKMVFPGDNPSTNIAAKNISDSEHYDLEKAFQYFTAEEGRESGYHYLCACWKFFCIERSSARTVPSKQKFAKMVELLDKNFERQFVIMSVQLLTNYMSNEQLNPRVVDLISDTMIKRNRITSLLSSEEKIDTYLVFIGFLQKSSSIMLTIDRSIDFLDQAADVCTEISKMPMSESQKHLYQNVVKQNIDAMKNLHSFKKEMTGNAASNKNKQDSVNPPTDTEVEVVDFGPASPKSSGKSMKI